MQKASKELIKDKMCLKEDPGRLGWSRRFDPPCKGVGSHRSWGPERKRGGWTASPGPAPAGRLSREAPKGSFVRPCISYARRWFSLRMEDDGRRNERGRKLSSLWRGRRDFFSPGLADVVRACVPSSTCV